MSPPVWEEVEAGELAHFARARVTAPVGLFTTDLEEARKVDCT